MIADTGRLGSLDLVELNPSLDVRNTTVADEIRSLEERISAGQRNLDAYEENLRAQFTSLEVLVQSLKSQGGFLTSALGSLS